jgi:hypothetical protein
MFGLALYNETSRIGTLSLYLKTEAITSETSCVCFIQKMHSVDVEIKSSLTGSAV